MLSIDIQSTKSRLNAAGFEDQKADAIIHELNLLAQLANKELMTKEDFQREINNFLNSIENLNNKPSMNHKNLRNVLIKWLIGTVVAVQALTLFTLKYMPGNV